MKKLNKTFINSILLLICFTISSFLLGCKTVPVGKIVDPINLIDYKSGFYIAIPKDADPVLIERIVSKYIPGLQEKNVNLICDKTNKIYLGINRTRNDTQLQASIDGDIPVRYIPKVLTKKNGWTVKDLQVGNSDKIYSVYNTNDFDVAFPAQNIVCIGRDMDYMINKYDMLSSIPVDLSLENPVIEDDYNSDLPRTVYDYLKGAETDIRFYAKNPQSFLTILTGTNLNLKLIDVSGSFTVDPKRDDQYLLDMTFNFKENKFLKAGKALLNLAFGLSNSQSDTIGDSSLEIKGIRISKEMLYKILVL